MGGGQIWADVRRTLIGCGGFFQALQLLERVAQIVMCLGIVGPPGHGGRVEFHRIVKVAAFERNHAGKTEHVGTAGLERQDLAAGPKRVAKLP